MRPLERFRLPFLLERYPARAVWAAFVGINGFVTIGILGAIAAASGTPFIFPSLGPTALLLFFDPASETASPRNTVFGHGLGILCGYAALVAVGPAVAPPPAVAGLHAARAAGAALSLISTGVLMIVFDVWHPPAGATTLIVSLGIIRRPYHLLIIELAVVLLAAQAVVINKAAGLDFPAWSRRLTRPPRPRPRP